MKGRRAFALVFSFFFAAVQVAQAQSAVGAVTQGNLDVQHGQIDWTNRTITATGSGAPDLKAPNVAVARLGAERVAKLDALRNILEALKGVYIDSSITVEKELVTNSKMRARVEGIIRNFKVLKTKYYSDGGVDLIVQVSLDGPLGPALVEPHKKGKIEVPTSGKQEHTGLIIDARGLKLIPALAPRVLDESGKPVYGPECLTSQALEKWGVAAYYRDIKAARKDARVGANPLVIKAISKADGSSSDVVISNADAMKLRDPNSNLSFLAEGRVVVVVD